MRTVSTIKPIDTVIIERRKDGLCDLILISNIKEIKDEPNNTVQYEYDMYRDTVPYRDNLKYTVKKDLDSWIRWAKNNEDKRKAKKTTPEIVQEIQEQQLDNLEMNIDQEARISLLEMGLEGGE